MGMDWLKPYYISVGELGLQCQIFEMDRHRNTNAARDDPRPRTNTKNKENPAADAVYLIQNENEVLRMKNGELQLKIKELKLQLEVNSESIALRERQIEQVRNQIQRTTFKGDIEIENEKKLLLQKLALLKSNEDIILRKIREAREAAIFEEEKIGNIQMDRKGVEVEILSLQAQNEGTKVVLRNLEEENQKLRKENQTLISKRQVYEPKEKSLSIEIEERIRLIKNQQQNLRNLKKYQTLKLMRTILEAIKIKKMKEHMMKIQRYGLFRKLAKKKVTQLSLLRKKYLLFIKNKIIQQLRTSFSPLVEQQKAKLIVSLTHNRRVKAVIWRKWRNAAKQAEFTTIRRFEFQNVLQKLSESFAKTNLCAAFNMIKYLRNNPVRESAAILINNVFSNFMGRSQTNFLSCLRSAQRKHEFELQIDCSSKEQSQMLVLSLYFTSWCKYAKSRSIENINLKRRYFKQLKKLLMLKNRRKLGEMLHETNRKINGLDTASKIFTELKREAVFSRIDSLRQYKQSMSGKANTIESQLLEMRGDKITLYRQFSLLKVSAYLKKKMQKAFDIWRLRKQQSKVMFSIINLIEGKKSFDKNFAFSKILKKRFGMLKKSIRDKIQSCEFSYNYLLEENKHIKEILDKKQHELEKTKFTNIVKKIMKDEKEVKLKYFYKFLKNGYKYWKFRKTVERVDRFVDKKVKIVVMWLLKQNNQEFREQNRIDSFVLEREALIHKNIYKTVLKGFKFVIERNRRVRRIMAGIFSRNLELDSYLAFGKIRDIDHIQARAEIQASIDHVRTEIMARNSVSTTESQTIQILTNRLKDKEEIFQERKILGLFKFFVKNIYVKIGASFTKWRTRVSRENKVMQFAEILERKSRILMKNKFMLNINRKNEDYTINDLQQKLKRYQTQFGQSSGDQQRFLQEKESQSVRMKEQNIFFKREGQIFQKKTEYMVNIKIKAHEKQWGKKMVAFAFREWRKQKAIFQYAWAAIENTLNIRVVKETFEFIAREMKEENLKARLRRTLSRIYGETYRQNAGMAFKSWRLTNLRTKQQQWQEEQRKQMKRFVVLQDKQNNAIKKHNMQVDYRAHDGKVRKIYNVWRQYAQKKIRNNIKKEHLSTFMIRDYGSQFFRLLKHRVRGPVAFKQTLNNFIQKCKIKRVRVFYTYTVSMKVQRHTVQRLFINKYCPFVINQVHQQFFSKIKNYNHNNIVNKKDHITHKIQTVIQTFEKKRKSVLNCYLRRWRRNEYEMRIAKNLMRRLTKNAMNWRVRDLFYVWKLETEAKNVKKMHEEEGEVRKRIIEINRLKVFLQDFKKQKGLLLEDDTGQLVVSPRFQQKKQQQIKKDNNSRYRFISRLILSMNGYAAPVKAWNNLKMYMSVRQKIKRIALLTKNCLRKPDLSHAFRVWLKATKDFNSMFQTMERKDLIRILNRQKDKMEMEYSKKIDLEQKIHEEMKAHKMFAYQEDRKQKLCAHIIVKNIRKVKTYALLAWKSRVDQIKDYDMDQLEDQGNSKINGLQEEVNDLEASENQLRQNNEKLEQAVKEALQIAEMVKRITEQRDILSNLITEKQMTCESLQEQNQKLNAKLYLAQKQAMNLLILSGERL